MVNRFGFTLLLVCLLAGCGDYPKTVEEYCDPVLQYRVRKASQAEGYSMELWVGYQIVTGPCQWDWIRRVRRVYVERDVSSVDEARGIVEAERQKFLAQYPRPTRGPATPPS